MKKVLSRWLLPLVLAFGLVGNVAATEDGTHEHGSGGDQSDDGLSTFYFSKNFSDGKIGKDFTREIKEFSLDSLSSFNASIFSSSGIKPFVGSILGRDNVFAQSFLIGESGSFSYLLDPGTYSFLLLGTVTGKNAGYAGMISAAPVPEPAEWMMIMAGVAMMGFVVSRRRANG